MHVRRTGLRTGLLVLICLALLWSGRAEGDTRSSGGYIVQSSSAATAAELVRQAGGAVTQPLALIDGVAAQLSPDALARLQADRRVVLHQDPGVQASAKPGPSAPNNTDTATQPLLYPAAASGVLQLRASQSGQVQTPNLRCQNQRVSDAGGTTLRNLEGWGVTVAVIDSGFGPLDKPTSWKKHDGATHTFYAENAEGRCLIFRDFLPVSKENLNDPANANNSVDQYGHGTHVVGTIADGREDEAFPGAGVSPVGIAPKVNLMIARALDKNGAGTYADVIAAIEWVIQNKSTYNVRVLNLSLYSPVGGPYWADPLNQAVMKAWQAGIVVVAAAGNAGPEAATITAPGNVPYVITVGAAKSSYYTASGQTEVATYSSRGPTESAFVKPDLTVWGSRTLAPMPTSATLPLSLLPLCTGGPSDPKPCAQLAAFPSYGFGASPRNQQYYYLSGTSMAAAEISGVAALLLQANPQLTNNQVKARLLGTARPLTDGAGQIAYTPWEQGAGVVDPLAAAQSTDAAAANQGMDIALDLITNTDPQTHYWGATVWDAQAQEFRLIDPDTGLPIATWAGSTRTWAGGTRIWSGSTRTWAGSTRTWAGSTRTWAGSVELWAGSDRSWVNVPAATFQNGGARGGIAPNDQ
jgi:subtilisin family serine protease